MTTVTDNWLAAAQGTEERPRFLLELPELGLYYASHVLPNLEPVAFDQGLVFNGTWLLDAARTTYDPRIAEGGIGDITIALDQRGRSGRVGNVNIALNNADFFSAGLVEAAVDNTLARILLGFESLRLSDFALLFTGVVDNTTGTDQLFRLSLVDNSIRFRRSLSIPIGSPQVYPGTPIRNRGKVIPIILGRQTNIACIKIFERVEATLAFEAAAGDTEIFIQEFGAPFPNGYDIQVGTDNAAYTGREYRVRQGITYLTLTGVTGLGGSVELPGEIVRTQLEEDEYLVGYEVKAVTEVRDDDGVIDPGDYTITLVDNEAEQATTKIVFNVDPTGTVFVDADGINIVDDPAEILNGSFETGTTADWTLEAGGTASVLSGDPLDGDFHLDLEGVNNDYRRLYQDISTIKDRFYTVRLFYRDVIPTANLLTNGDFATGDTTGWTLVDDPVYFGAQTSVEINRNAFRLVFRKIIGGPFGAGGLGDLLRRFKYSLYQDITTSIGATYQVLGEGSIFSWDAGENPYSGIRSQGGGGTGEAGGAAGNTQFFWQVQFNQRLTLQAGPVGTPTADLDERIESLGPDTKFGSFNTTFVASDTTTRITIEVDSRSGWDAPEMVIGPFFIYEASVDRSSLSRVEIGSAADPGAVLGEDLPRIYSWQQRDFTFQAVAGVTRFHLASQWIGDTAVGSHFDDVGLFDGGRNPAEAIAYIVDTFLPELSRDVSTFDTAYGKLLGWQFGAYIADPGDSEQLLEDMSFQCMSRLRRDENDVISMQVLDFEGRPDTTFDESNIKDGSFSYSREPIDNIFTRFRVWFGRATEEQDDFQGFQGVVEAAPDFSTDPEEDLRVYCKAAEKIYRGVHEFTYAAEMIRDIDTAHFFLRWLVKSKTNRHFNLSFQTWHEFGVPLVVGDPILVMYPNFANFLPYICQVLSKKVTETGVQIVARTIRIGGFFEPWEENFDLEANLKLFEPWEA